MANTVSKSTGVRVTRAVSGTRRLSPTTDARTQGLALNAGRFRRTPRPPLGPMVVPKNARSLASWSPDRWATWCSKSSSASRLCASATRMFARVTGAGCSHARGVLGMENDDPKARLGSGYTHNHRDGQPSLGTYTPDASSIHTLGWWCTPNTNPLPSVEGTPTGQDSV